MQRFIQKIKKRENWRRIVAVAFLVFLLAEWGSHSVIEADIAYSDIPSVSAHESQHGDLCKTFILCSDNGRNDQQRSDLGRDMTPHGAPLGLFPDLSRRTDLLGGSPLEFLAGHALRRSISPPFHPPEIS